MKQILFFLLGFVSFSLTAQTKSNPVVTHPVKEVKAEPVKTATAPAAVKSELTPAPAQEAEKTNAVMTFESTVVDYGTIDNGSEPLRVVKFTNTGTDPLVIKNARGSCGCTVPTWEKSPIAPGQSSTIEIRYDTKRTGPINKSVTITTNEGPENHVLQVIGTVLPPKKDESVPAAEPSMIKGN
ncbi:MAG: DUF1573 domain-containing protein [Chitinophagales bacterium]|nr:DUF1573 domain-containing protein [Chitinophagales bacterium]